MKQRLVSFIIVVVLLFSIFTTMAFATEQYFPSGVADTEIGERIEAYIENHKETTAAVSAAVFRGQETLYKTAYGYANIEKGLAADDETVYEWGSVSKLLVWVSVMQLWEQGEILLNTDVREYLPDGFLTKLKYDAPITMLNLMNHNAGWQDAIFQMCATDADSVLPLNEALRATEPAQIFEPGTVSAYSNWGVALAGYIVENISGQPFYEYVQDNIFKPLGMEKSALSPTLSDNEWVLSKLLEAQGYTSELTPINDGLFYLNIYPAGSAAGTLDDFLAFAKALVPNSEGAAKLFKKDETIVEMFSPTLHYDDTDINYISHGFWWHEFNVPTLGHGGNTNMFSSYLMLDPVSGVGMVIMTNQNNELAYNFGLPKLVFGEMGQMRSGNVKTDISKMAGLYYSGRTIKQGIGKMYTLLGLKPMLEDGSGNLKASLFGLAEVKAMQIEVDTLLITQRMGEFEVDMLGRYSESNGVKKISTLYGDMIEADADVWACVLAIVLLVIAVVWSVGVLISSLIRFIVHKIKKHRKRGDSFKKYQLILCVALLLLVVNIISVAGTMFTLEGSAAALMPNVIASIILGVIPLGYAVLLAMNWRKFNWSKSQRAAYIITLFMGFVITFNILALEMYRL